MFKLLLVGQLATGLAVLRHNRRARLARDDGMPHIPTEPIGSIPRPLALIEAVAAKGGEDPALEPLYEQAVRDTIERFEATGSPVITDGEQRKYHNFWTYCVQGLPNTAPDGFQIPFSAGHVRRMLRLTAGPSATRRMRTVTSTWRSNTRIGR